MSTIRIAVTGICAGGGHVHATVQVDDGQARPVMFETDDLRTTPSEEELREAAKTLLRAHLMGKSRADARTLLEAGIEIGVAKPRAGAVSK